MLEPKPERTSCNIARTIDRLSTPGRPSHEYAPHGKPSKTTTGPVRLTGGRPNRVVRWNYLGSLPPRKRID